MKSAATQFDESTRQEKTTTSTSSYTRTKFWKGAGREKELGGRCSAVGSWRISSFFFFIFFFLFSPPCAFVTFVSFDYRRALSPLLYPRLLSLYAYIAYLLRREMKWNPVRLPPSSFSPFCCLLNARSLHLYVFAPGWVKGRGVESPIPHDPRQIHI